MSNEQNGAEQINWFLVFATAGFYLVYKKWGVKGISAIVAFVIVIGIINGGNKKETPVDTKPTTETVVNEKRIDNSEAEKIAKEKALAEKVAKEKAEAEKIAKSKGFKTVDSYERTKKLKYAFDEIEKIRLKTQYTTFSFKFDKVYGSSNHDNYFYRLNQYKPDGTKHEGYSQSDMDIYIDGKTVTMKGQMYDYWAGGEITRGTHDLVFSTEDEAKKFKDVVGTFLHTDDYYFKRLDLLK
jgi:hypothetical protein